MLRAKLKDLAQSAKTLTCLEDSLATLSRHWENDPLYHSCSQETA